MVAVRRIFTPEFVRDSQVTPRERGTPSSEHSMNVTKLGRENFFSLVSEMSDLKVGSQDEERNARLYRGGSRSRVGEQKARVKSLS